MTVQGLRQLFKLCGDDTRLRILNILNENILTVKEMSEYLGKSQPSISKHLAQLRLFKMVVDRRVGNQVYYTIKRKEGAAQTKVIEFIVTEFRDIGMFENDRKCVSLGKTK